VAAILPGVSDAQAEEPPQPAQRLAIAEMTQSPASEGKGDMLVVNREGKGSLLRTSSKHAIIARRRAAPPGGPFAFGRHQAGRRCGIGHEPLQNKTCPGRAQA